jgi:hypothetical protein
MKCVMTTRLAHAMVVPLDGTGGCLAREGAAPDVSALARLAKPLTSRRRRSQRRRSRKRTRTSQQRRRLPRSRRFLLSWSKTLENPPLRQRMIRGYVQFSVFAWFVIYCRL